MRLVAVDGLSGNASCIELLAQLFNAMLKDYSKRFGFADGTLMPTAIIDIAPFDVNNPSDALNISRQPINDVFFNIAEANSGAVVSVPIYDIEPKEGGKGAIHPAIKNPIGIRAARALAALGTNAYLFPEYESVSFSGSKAIIKFSNVGQGLTATTTVLGFRMAGADGRHYPATATIIAPDTVELTSEQVQTPASVSYAYSNYNYGANMVNSLGLPLRPFRTSQNSYVNINPN